MQYLDQSYSSYPGQVVRPPAYAQRPINAYRMSPEDALDAADGILDRRYYGAPIIGAGARYPAQSPYLKYPDPLISSPYRMSSADILDAADGYMDGRYYGVPIVGSSRSPLALPNTYRHVGYSPYGYARQPGYPGSYTSYPAYPTSYTPSYAGSYRTGASPLPPLHRVEAPPMSTAQADALDAADGVIDGKFYGQKVIGSTENQIADALDAADGVMDGKFFGQNLAAASRNPEHEYSNYGGHPYYGMKVVERSVRGSRKKILKINSVIPGGPAQKAGLMVGDVLHKFCGVELVNQAQLSHLMRASQVGSTVLFEVDRRRTREFITVTVEGDFDDVDEGMHMDAYGHVHHPTYGVHHAFETAPAYYDYPQYAQPILPIPVPVPARAPIPVRDPSPARAPTSSLKTFSC